eukprot:SAG11_NODE_6862_length_1234_cov_1.277533_1_plen_188_part_00
MARRSERVATRRHALGGLALFLLATAATVAVTKWAAPASAPQPRRRLEAAEVAVRCGDVGNLTCSDNVTYLAQLHFVSDHVEYGPLCKCFPHAVCTERSDPYYLDTTSGSYPRCECDRWHEAGAGETVWRVFAIFYLFCGIAIVCDDFFTASLGPPSTARSPHPASLLAVEKRVGAKARVQGVSIRQ